MERRLDAQDLGWFLIGEFRSENVRGFAHPKKYLRDQGLKPLLAPLGVGDFFVFRCSLRSETPKSICQQASPGSFDSALKTLCLR